MREVQYNLDMNDWHDSIPDFERRKAKYAPVSTELRNVFGYPDWRPFSATPTDELIDCILSQSTTDLNRDRAFAALKAKFPTWYDVMTAPTADVVDAIRPAGLANQKAPRIQNILRAIDDQFGTVEIDFLRDMDLEDARKWLMSLDGVGPKTAAIVLCFGFNRAAFPVDTHIHRVGQRIGFLPTGISAEKAHPLMEAIVPPEDYFAFHLNMIRLGREICAARRPACERCPLMAHCDYFQAISFEPISRQSE